MKFSLLLNAIIFYVVMVFASACGAAETISSDVIFTSDFVIDATTKPTPDNYLGEAICITIHEGKLWRPGDFAGALTQRLFKETRLWVNDVIVPKDKISAFSYGTLILEYEGDEVVGSWSGPINFCFDVSGLWAGEYQATIEVSPRLDERYTYSWTFVVE